MSLKRKAHTMHLNTMLPRPPWLTRDETKRYNKIKNHYMKQLRQLQITLEPGLAARICDFVVLHMYIHRMELQLMPDAGTGDAPPPVSLPLFEALAKQRERLRKACAELECAIRAAAQDAQKGKPQNLADFMAVLLKEQEELMKEQVDAPGSSDAPSDTGELEMRETRILPAPLDNSPESCQDTQHQGDQCHTHTLYGNKDSPQYSSASSSAPPFSSPDAKASAPQNMPKKNKSPCSPPAIAPVRNAATGNAPGSGWAVLYTSPGPAKERKKTWG